MKNHILTRLTCETSFMELTSGNFMGDFKNCTDTVSMLRPARSVVRPYSKNQKLQPDYIEADRVFLTAGKAAYFDVKLDQLDDQMICNSAQLLNNYTEDAISQFKYLMELDVFGTMLYEVHEYNQGCCAGARTHSYDLGSPTKPIGLSAVEGDRNDILRKLQELFAVLAEACAVTPGMGYKISGGGGEPFLALPYAGWMMLQRTLSRCCPQGGVEATPMVNGRIPTRIGGFHAYIMNGIPSALVEIANGNKVTAYQILAGRRDATGFVKIVDKVRKITDDPESFQIRVQGLTAWGAAVLRPEALAAMHVYFKED